MVTDINTLQLWSDAERHSKVVTWINEYTF